MTDIFGHPPPDPWPGCEPAVNHPPNPLPDVFEPMRLAGEGAGNFAARMLFIREMVKLWRKTWKQVSRERRQDFAEAVLNYAAGALDRFAVQVVSRWLEQPGVWDRLEVLVEDEARTRFARAVLQRAEQALNERDWDGKPMVCRAMEAAALRELGELERRQAVEAMAPKDGETQ